ncbi:hypothetical protein ACFFLM_02900 [Deinococcus oregonensis]|uniref:Uncharacterized protein n=1 Tax=Deinococcus oregonensis TaxID=1805970 RepID=A0ABV6ATU4_9DEIO
MAESSGDGENGLRLWTAEQRGSLVGQSERQARPAGVADLSGVVARDEN